MKEGPGVLPTRWDQHPAPLPTGCAAGFYQYSQMNNSTRLATIDGLLKDVPRFDCKTGCSDCCGPVIMSRLEMKRICERTGKKPAELDVMTVLKSADCLCPLLDRSTHRCTVYDIRPAICKVFGSSLHERLACPHGCGPKAPMPPKETDALIDRCSELGHGLTVTLR